MMWHNQSLCKLLDIDYPIIQAPMAGATTPEMAAAAANAGALGSLGCALSSMEKCHAEASKAKRLTNRSLNMNFFVHSPPKKDFEKEKVAIDKLKSWYDNLNAGPIPEVVARNFPFDEKMCEVVCQIAPKVVSFHFGMPDASLVNTLKQAGIIILSSATSQEEAKFLEGHGADAIIAQGYEAGGHSGWFLPRGNTNTAGTIALVPRIVDAVNVPVIASGGIADGRGIAAALMLGAAGVQIGTAFLATPESQISLAHKQALLSATGDDTMLSKAFSGRNARTISNAYANAMKEVKDLPDFPLMNTLTAPLRKASSEQGKPDAIALWSGQAAGLVQEIGTAELIAKLVTDTEKTLQSTLM